MVAVSQKVQPAGSVTRFTDGNDGSIKGALMGRILWIRRFTLRKGDGDEAYRRVHVVGVLGFAALGFAAFAAFADGFGCTQTPLDRFHDG